MAEPSHSPAPPRKKSRGPRLGTLIGWGAASSAATVVAGIFAGQIWLEGYLKSDAFRERTQASLGKALRADTVITRPQRSGTTIYLETLDATGTVPSRQPPARFRELHALGVRAELDLTAVWRRAWKVDAISIQRVQCDLTPLPASTDAGGVAGDSSAAPSAGGSWLASLLPRRTELGPIRVERADLTRGENQLRRVRLVATPSESGGEWALSAEDGELALGAWPRMAPTQLHSARVQIKRGSTVLRDSKLLLASGGQCALNGEWKESGASELRAKLEGVQIQPFLPEWWQSRIFGAVDGDLLIQQPAPGTLRWEGNVSMKNGKLEALPILSELDLFLGSPRFRSVPLRAASVKIVQAGGVTELREIKMDADGLLRVEGDVRIQDAQLEGLLQVGISPALVQWLPGVRSKIFSENRDGYVWAPMKLGGTVLQPVEDLSRRLAAAAAGSVLDTVRNVVTPPARPGETTQPANAGDTPKPNPLLAPVQTAVDTIKSLIPGK